MAAEGRLRTALFTDLYELTMAQAYHAEQMDQLAVVARPERMREDAPSSRSRTSSGV